MMVSSIEAKLVKIQTEIKAPKNLHNSFGGYNYRNVEGICEAVKPYLKDNNCTLILTDEIIAVGDRIYVKATATISDAETRSAISVSAFARESQVKKGMDDSQITGAASSYARKYALNGLFLLDDTKDPDTDEYQKQTSKKQTSKEQNEADQAEKFDKKCEEVGRMKISELKVDIIRKKCADEGVPEKKVLDLYKITKFEDMTENMFRNAMNFWSKIKEMK